ncbi:MAG: hypothetical protein LBU04_01580 [Christensenellaceae bacterium]|jgi:tetratricopeptide (TPR) repeat protein|nr:hypothetical protein [Christensenellaceae bacterium]
MKHDANTNTLISQIMSNTASAVMLFAPGGSRKTDFLSELASRYQTIYWFNPIDCCMSVFIYSLINKVIKKENPPLALKLSQLMYCKSEFNNESVVITAVLDYIAEKKSNCIMIFERMHYLPSNFNLALIERLIKQSPSNLKVIVSSNNYINFDFSQFDPIYPILIDEDVLLSHTFQMTAEDYIADLTPQEIAFLIYFAPKLAVDIDLIKEIYPERVELVQMLNRKGYYISMRDDVIHFNSVLVNYLLSIKESYAEYASTYSKEKIESLLAKHKCKSGDSCFATRLFAEIGDDAGIDDVIKRSLCKREIILRAVDNVYFYCNLLKASTSELPYRNLIYSFTCVKRGNFRESLEVLSDCIIKFRERGDVLAEVIAVCRKIRVSSMVQELTPEFKNEILNILYNPDKEYVACRSLLMAYMLEYRKVTNTTASEAEKIINSTESTKDLHYIKNKEQLAHAYFDIGNYKRALEITSDIKYYLSYYVIPHKFIAFKYYAGEIDIAKSMLKDALSFAQENNITEDTSLLYSTLATIDIYEGKVKEALEGYDFAIKQDKTDNYAKFFNIAERCVAYARFKNPNYAKEIAHIYLKYCSTFKPEFTHMMLTSIAFAYLKMEEHEKAYTYALKCVQSSPAHTTYWLVCMAIVTSFRLKSSNLKDATSLVSNILRSSYNYGMEMIVVDYFDECFASLIAVAKFHKIETDYIDRIESIITTKNKLSVVGESLSVMLFGNVQILSRDKVIVWKTRKSKDLFLHYFLAGSVGIDRNNIINIFWKDYLYISAINNLKTTNSIIRNTLTDLGIEFELTYTNAKYILKLPNVKSDYISYCELKDKYNDELPLSKKTKLIVSMLKLYKGDFAPDVMYPDFVYENKILKSELISMLHKLVRELGKRGDYMEAKRFLTQLTLLDAHSDYTRMLSELNAHIKSIIK